VRVSIVASSPQDPERNHYLTTFLVNGTLAVDAGSLGLYRDPGDQTAVRNILLTHSHADHIGSLPVFLENTSWHRRETPALYGSGTTLESLRQHVFNDRIWPDLSRLSGENGRFLDLHALEPEKPVDLGGLRITPVAVHHTVPTFGYLVDDGTVAVAFGGDSGPTDRIWELARAGSPLRGAFLECTFPDSMTVHAHRTGHLTPSLLAAEMTKLPEGTRVIVVHIRPAFRIEVEAELAALGKSAVRLGRGGADYDF